MKHPVARTLILAGAVLGAAVAPAAAQYAPSRSERSLVPARFPRWDAGGSFAIWSLSPSETRNTWADWESHAEYRADVGRYWTTHLKTEVAFSATNQWIDYDEVPYPVPGITRPAYAYFPTERQLFAIAPAVTWQFRENTLMHPYVGGGVKVGMLREHRFGSSSDTVTRAEERTTTVTARPFVAGGFKSYLSRSVFVRTEAHLAFASDGICQMNVGIGLGVDF